MPHKPQPTHRALGKTQRIARGASTDWLRQRCNPTPYNCNTTLGFYTDIQEARVLLLAVDMVIVYVYLQALIGLVTASKTWEIYSVSISWYNLLDINTYQIIQWKPLFYKHFLIGIYFLSSCVFHCNSFIKVYFCSFILSITIRFIIIFYILKLIPTVILSITIRLYIIH